MDVSLWSLQFTRVGETAAHSRACPLRGGHLDPRHETEFAQKLIAVIPPKAKRTHIVTCRRTDCYPVTPARAYIASYLPAPNFQEVALRLFGRLNRTSTEVWTCVRGFIKKLLDNAKVVRFLNTSHRDILAEFESLAAAETL